MKRKLTKAEFDILRQCIGSIFSTFTGYYCRKDDNTYEDVQRMVAQGLMELKNGEDKNSESVLYDVTDKGYIAFGRKWYEVAEGGENAGGEKEVKTISLSQGFSYVLASALSHELAARAQSGSRIQTSFLSYYIIGSADERWADVQEMVEAGLLVDHGTGLPLGYDHYFTVTEKGKSAFHSGSYEVKRPTQEEKDAAHALFLEKMNDVVFSEVKKRDVEWNVIDVGELSSHFPRSLDACSWFEDFLEDNEWPLYLACLGAIVRESGVSYAPERALLCSHPEQRCEAFLKTVGRWAECR